MVLHRLRRIIWFWKSLLAALIDSYSFCRCTSSVRANSSTLTASRSLVIWGIKFVKNPTEGAESFRKAVDCFIECVLWYCEQGANVMALACTEIPVVLKECVLRSDPRVAGRDIHIVDSVVALSQSIMGNLTSGEVEDEEEGE